MTDWVAERGVCGIRSDCALPRGHLGTCQTQAQLEARWRARDSRNAVHALLDRAWARLRRS